DEAGDCPGGQADEAFENEVEDVVGGARAFWFFWAGRVKFFLFHTVITQQKTRVCLNKRGKNETIFKIFLAASSQRRKPLTSLTNNKEEVRIRNGKWRESKFLVRICPRGLW
ncbi:MAG: hypothetical protein LBT33_00955, partial [Spirochaetia bacterium]|nr:hypothetical protein [Spirochaetia bacterium]